MAQLLPKIRARYGENIGVELLCSFPEIYDNQRTYLDADCAIGASTLSADGLNFAANQYVVIGQPGAIKSEILKITSVTATSIVTGATSFAHSRGDIIRFIPYNQITLEVSSNGGVSYVANSAVDIRADSSETYIQQSSDLSTYYYKFRFYNSTTGIYSAYSDPTIATGFGPSTVWAIKDRALSQLGERKSALITDKVLNDAIYEARRIMDQNPAVYRFSFRTSFNTSIGQCISGAWSVAAPTDLRDRNTYKNILGLRIGRQYRPCVYQDRVRFNQNYQNVAHSTLNGTVAFGATTITLTSTKDFDDSGTCYAAGSAVGTLKDAFTYTANNRATNVLSGVTGVPAAGYASGSDVWQNGTFGLPSAYTIDAGYIYFDTPFSDDLDGRSITMDYYKAISTVTTDGDTFDEPFYDHYVAYLKWKIKYVKANGKIKQDEDPDYKEWQAGVAMVIGQETAGQRISFIPDIEGFLSSQD